MINKNFVIPPKEISIKETERRMSLLPKIFELFKNSCDAIVITGSLATGKNYSVHPDSDIDISFLVTKDSISQLKNHSFLSDQNFQHYLEGYKKDIAHQFSTDNTMEGVKIECHFWDKDVYLNAIQQRAEHVMRFRSSNISPSVNYGFGFEKQEITTELPTEKVEDWFISPFPLFIRENNTFFPCRGLTSLLATPVILKGADILKKPIDLAWKWIAEEFKAESFFSNSNPSVSNSIPGNWKFAEETKIFISEMTKKYI
jgi:hypothetical protein